MLLEVLDKDKETSITLYIYDKLDADVSAYLPFTAEAMLWKEELYFETPIELSNIEELKATLAIDYGRLYYWPPGRAFCIFYGMSEPYTKVYDIGYLVTNPHYSLAFDDGDELTIQEHKIDKEYEDVVLVLKNLGYTASTPLQAGDKVVAASKFVDNRFLSINVYKEDYGIHVESNPLFEYDGLYDTIKALKKLKKTLQGKYKFSRLDLSEEGFVVITAIADNINELANVTKELEKAYLQALNLLEI